ncbi:hypothetical protein GCM10023224_21300 [Streptomonospora halophila]|uniref:Uncharacterized protein n=1 Tax=Streptomonospora halophila TaxID=427369 RepID=A0ABP9GKT0_9ACTN
MSSRAASHSSVSAWPCRRHLLIAHGCDVHRGAYVAPEIARAAPERVVGVYITAGLGFPTEADIPDLTPDELEQYNEIRRWSTGGLDHHALLRRGPQTFAYGWNDSPAALLGWLVHKFEEFSMAAEPLDEVIDRDLLLTNASLYWFTQSAGTSSWPMYETGEFGRPQGQDRVPTGVYAGPPAIRRLAERDNRIEHWPEGNTGRHHFVAMESPGPYANDMRVFFGAVR